MQLDIVSKEMVKPSIPTPIDKRTHALSFFDQVSPQIYIPIAFFYPMASYRSSSLLKKSLSFALTKYYPLAGRTKDNTTIECNDEGVVYMEARMANRELSQIIKHTSGEDLNLIIKLLLPENLPYIDSTSGSPLVVQVTSFRCGGMVIAMCICHKIMDISSICNFIRSWAAICHERDEAMSMVTPPEFNLGSIYPPIIDPTIDSPNLGKMPDCVSRRLVFNASKVAKLKSMVAEKVEDPTRVEVVLALVFACAVSAAKASSAVLYQAVNLRQRVSSPFPDSSIGNLAWSFPASTTKEKTKLELHWLVSEIRREKTEFFNSFSNIPREELASSVLESWKRWAMGDWGESDIYRCSSWCRFPFYEAGDFGWGMPIWVTTTCFEIKNSVVMMDTRGGEGIEVFLTLGEEEMAIFEHDQQLLEFAVVDPCPLADGEL